MMRGVAGHKPYANTHGSRTIDIGEKLSDFCSGGGQFRSNLA